MASRRPIIWYVLQTKHAIAEDTLQKPCLLVSRADFEVPKWQKVPHPPPSIALLDMAKTSPASAILRSRHGSGVVPMFAAFAASFTSCSHHVSGMLYASYVFFRTLGVRLWANRWLACIRRSSRHHCNHRSRPNHNIRL